MNVNFQVVKDKLMEGFERLFPVATKGLASDYSMGNKMTMAVKGKTLLLRTSNGHLAAEYSVPLVECKEEGVATVDIVVGRNVARALGEASSVIEFSSAEDGLHLSDVTKRRKRHVKLQVLGTNHDFKITAPKGGLRHSFDTDMLVGAWTTVGKYKSDRQYKIKYLMTCMHFLPETTRFVCGDGMRFAVLEQKNRQTCDVDAAGKKYLVPVDQSLIIAAALEGTTQTNLTFESQQECYIEGESAGEVNLRLLLKGIPKEEYISYETHAYRYKDAVAIVDLPMSQFAELVSVTGSVRSKGDERTGKFHTVVFDANAGGLDLHVDEGSNRADVDDDCTFHKISQDAFKSAYCWSFFSDVAMCGSYDSVRIYCVDENGILLVEPCSLDETKGDHNIPHLKEMPSGRILFFFAAATEDEE